MKVKPQTLSGFMELLPEKQIFFQSISDKIRNSFELFGFTPLDTPIIESSEVLLAKAGGDTEKQIYRFMKGDRDLSLRFDLTVPFAKYVAKNYGQLTFPFRRYQIGKAYRGERAQRGRFREFYQCDVDIIGDGELDLSNEADIPAIIYTTLNAIGIADFEIRLSNRRILNGLCEILDIADPKGVLHAVDKIYKIGDTATVELLVKELRLAADTANAIVEFAAAENAVAALDKFYGKNETFDRGADELREVMRQIEALGVPATHCRADLRIVRGLDYYTGTVYETFMTRHPEIGSICSGGRYDNLAEYYTDKRLPGVGVSIGLTRLFYILDEQGMLNPELSTSPADVLIIPMTDDNTIALSIATKMRTAGIRTQVYSENRKKFKARMSYADKIGVPFVALLGEDEIAQDKLTIKDMRSGEQFTASAAVIIAGIQDKLANMCNIKPIK